MQSSEDAQLHSSKSSRVPSLSISGYDPRLSLHDPEKRLQAAQFFSLGCVGFCSISCNAWIRDDEERDLASFPRGLGGDDECVVAECKLRLSFELLICVKFKGSESVPTPSNSST